MHFDSWRYDESMKSSKFVIPSKKVSEYASAVFSNILALYPSKGEHGYWSWVFREGSKGQSAVTIVTPRPQFSTMELPSSLNFQPWSYPIPQFSTMELPLSPIFNYGATLSPMFNHGATCIPQFSTMELPPSPNFQPWSYPCPPIFIHGVTPQFSTKNMYITANWFRF